MQKQLKILSKAEPQNASDVLAILLKNRNIDKSKEKTFFHPDLKEVTLENVNIDSKEVQKAHKRIAKAIENKEQIVVYGDYDVDGITGAAILWETLNDLDAKVTPYIPNRVEEGYGLSIAGITNLTLEVKDIKLIITVDNGIVANDAVDFANKEGIDVIITDHHLPHIDEKHTNPKAHSIVHTTKLCGAGVAWVFSKSLRSHFEKDNEVLDNSHLELATLGTIADLVSLQDANRTLVYYGLKEIQKTKRPGIRALCQEAGISPDTIGVYEIGFMLSPRLNASGRLDSAMDSLRLLCTVDQKRAYDLAGKLGLTNKERQRVMFEAAQHASSEVRSRKTITKLLIVSHESYREGVIGLVAGKLVEEYYRPAIVISKGKTISKGSVRSISGFDIITFLRSSSEFFINVGGHPMAAGFTIETQKIEEFKSALEELAEKAILDELLSKTLTIDCALPFSFITPELYLQVQTLAPFGMGNSQPVFISKGITIRDTRLLGKEKKHLRFILQDETSGKLFEAIAFGMGALSGELQPDDIVDVVYTLDENTWNGNTKLQLKIKYVKKSDLAS